MRRTITLLLAAGLFVGLFAVPAAASSQRPTIAEIVVSASGDIGSGFDRNGNDYDILREAVVATGQVSLLLNESATLTVFAPNDRAFIRLAKSFDPSVRTEEQAFNTIAGLGIPTVANVVGYHVKAGEELTRYQVFFKRFWRTKTLDMANGDALEVRRFRLIDGTDNKIRPVWRATNIKASNGIIHTVAEVLLPPSLGA